MIFDSHAHYEDKKFDADRVELLSNMKDMGVEAIVNVGSTLETSQKSVKLAAEYDGVYAAVGIHPSEVADHNLDETLPQLEDLSNHPKVVALGEIGLDYYWDKDADIQLLQRQWFQEQLALEQKLNLPIIIHSRDAAADTFDILSKSGASDVVVHCYSGSAEMAAEYVKMGYYIGVGGVVTFKNGRRLRETVEAISLDSILLETDCPYMAPEPHRGDRNESSYIAHIADAIAKIKGVSAREVIERTAQNAYSFYRIER